MTNSELRQFRLKLYAWQRVLIDDGQHRFEAYLTDAFPKLGYVQIIDDETLRFAGYSTGQVWPVESNQQF